MRPIVRHIKNNELYEFLGGEKFKNIRTGICGEVSEEKAKNVFKFNIEATEMINEFPLVEELIKRLNLKMVKDGVGSM